MAKWSKDNLLLNEGLLGNKEKSDILDIKDFNGTMDIEEAYRTVSNRNEIRCYKIIETVTKRGDGGDYFSSPGVKREYKPYGWTNFASFFALSVDDDHVDELLKDLNNNFARLGYDKEHMATSVKKDFRVCFLVSMGDDKYHGDKPKFKVAPNKESKKNHHIDNAYGDLIFGFFPTWEDAKAYVDAGKCYRNRNLKISSVFKDIEHGGTNIKDYDLYDSNKPNRDHFKGMYNNRWWQRLLTSGAVFVRFFVDAR